jgi:NAD(P)-dependent dehydrogenase (short-subunit alcohol dehydrogenase family)
VNKEISNIEKEVLDKQHRHWGTTYSKNPDMFGLEPSDPAQKAVEIFKKEGKTKILELGGGQGRDTIFFAQSGFQVYVLDYSETGIEAITQKAQVLGLSQSITPVCHDIRKPLPFKDEFFDGCYSHMLYCMALTNSELEFLSEEIRRILKPRGLNIYTVRHTNDPHYRTGIHRGEDMYEVGGFVVHFFGKEKVKHLAKGRVAIVTGGARGIGKAIALCFAREGADLAIPDIDLEGAQKVAQEIEALGRKAIATQTDISERDQVADLIKRTVDKFGRVDILVNNAGIAKAEPFLETSMENWDNTIKVHLTGTFLCSQMAAREMAKNKWGRILNIASVGGLAGPPFGVAAYSAAKGGIISLTRALATELADHGIRVNAIAPGPIMTELYESIFTEEEAKERARSLPCYRLGKVDDIAQAALYFCSPESDFVTGQILSVDGGFTAIGGYSFETYRRRK